MLCLMSLESLVPQDHPLRRIRQLADEALSALSEDFDAMYAQVGRPRFRLSGSSRRRC